MLIDWLFRSWLVSADKDNLFRSWLVSADKDNLFRSWLVSADKDNLEPDLRLSSQRAELDLYLQNIDIRTRSNFKFKTSYYGISQFNDLTGV